MLDEKTKALIRWRCRRGMLELDLFFERFLDKQLEIFPKDKLEKLMELLQYPDPQLYAWFMGAEDPTDKELLEIVRLIRDNLYP